MVTHHEISHHDGPYRDDTAGAMHRREELRRAYLDRLDQLPAGLIHALARRVGRVAFGLVAALGGVTMFAVASSLESAVPLFSLRPSSVLLATWPLALAAYALAAAGTRGVARRGLARLATPSSDVYMDIDRLAAAHPERAMTRRIMGLEHLSIALPLAGLGLIGPLSLHALFGAIVLGASRGDIDEWICLSLLMVGLAHVWVVIFGWLFAREVGAAPLRASLLASTRWKRVYWAVAASAFPGVVVLVPVVITAITGVIYAPLVYLWIARSVEHEREFVLVHGRLEAGDRPAPATDRAT